MFADGIFWERVAGREQFQFLFALDRQSPAAERSRRRGEQLHPPPARKMLSSAGRQKMGGEGWFLMHRCAFTLPLQDFQCKAPEPGGAREETPHEQLRHVSFCSSRGGSTALHALGWIPALPPHLSAGSKRRGHTNALPKASLFWGRCWPGGELVNRGGKTQTGDLSLGFAGNSSKQWTGNLVMGHRFPRWKPAHYRVDVSVFRQRVSEIEGLVSNYLWKLCLYLSGGCII